MHRHPSIPPYPPSSPTRDIDKLCELRSTLWRELGHPPTIHSRHLAHFGRLADEVLRIEKEIELAYRDKRQSQAGRTQRWIKADRYRKMSRL